MVQGRGLLQMGIRALKSLASKSLYQGRMDKHGDVLEHGISMMMLSVNTVLGLLAQVVDPAENSTGRETVVLDLFNLQFDRHGSLCRS